MKRNVPSVKAAMAALALVAGWYSALTTTAADEPSASWRDTPAAVLDVFPESVVDIPVGKRGQTRLSSAYTPSGSLWGKHLREETVFHYEIKHIQDADNSFNLRIGKGGQLYSLRGAFGESVPPQGIGNPWNDEVWQFVSVCNTYNGFPIKSVPDEVAERFRNSPYAGSYFIHNSGAYIPSQVDSGTVTLSCDVRLNEDTPGLLDIIMRDTTANPWKTFGSLQVKKGSISFNGKEVSTAQPGVWYNVSISFELGKGYTGKADVTVKPDKREARTVAIPFSGPGINAWNWLGLSAGGTEQGIINLDNLTAKRVTGTQTEWPIKEDFEIYENGRYWGAGLVGADEAQGARILVTDRLAVSGKRSLEIRDAAGLGSPWQPMARLDVGTTIARNLYCPMLGADIPSDERTYRSVNWGIIPQLKTVHRSPILYYVQTRDIGNGVIEVTYVVHNFSVRDDISFEWLNAPWGGTRVTSLPFHYMSSPENELKDRDWVKKNCGAIDVRKTGGWNLSCATEEPDSASLSLVFGRDKHLEAELRRKEQGQPHCQISNSIYRHMGPILAEDWKTRPDNTFRNYEVAVVIPKFRLAPGTTIWYRSYLVVNRKDRTVELAKYLVDKVDYGYRVFDPATTPTVPVNLPGQGSFELFANPVPGTMPLFLIENKTTGREVTTTDPYIFVPQEKLDFGIPPEHPQADYYNQAIGYSMDENNTNWKRLLGYGYVDRPTSGNWIQLSSLLNPERFSKATTYDLDLWVRTRL